MSRCVARSLYALCPPAQRPRDTAARRQARESHFEASVFVQAALPRVSWVWAWACVHDVGC